MTVLLVDALTELAGVTITVRHELEPSAARLMVTLGVTVVVDPRAPSCEKTRYDVHARDGSTEVACRRCEALDREGAR